jgi:hypothetical protein
VATYFQDPAHNFGASASVGFQMDGANGCQWSYHDPLSVAPGMVLSIQAQAAPASADDNLNGVPDECEVVGDMNCDGTVDFGDINPYVLALTDPAGYTTTFPNCTLVHADINGDGSVDFGDINPFVALFGR